MAKFRPKKIKIKILIIYINSDVADSTKTEVSRRGFLKKKDKKFYPLLISDKFHPNLSSFFVLSLASPHSFFCAFASSFLRFFLCLVFVTTRPRRVERGLLPKWAL